MSTPYAAERGTPSIPTCKKGRVLLRFDGRFLSMIGPQARNYAAVSGRALDNGGFDYSISRQQERRVGPIPPGLYWVQPSQMWTNRWYSIAPRAAWGDHRLTIHVYPGTETFGRGGFFIHGGTHAGSAGCINLHAQMEKFVADLKAAAGESDCYVPLTVQYP